MKNQALALFALTAFAGFAHAGGWEKETSRLSWAKMCGNGPIPPKTSYVCFSSSGDVSGITRDTSFHGFQDPSHTKFVMYDGGQAMGMYQNLGYIVNTQYNVVVGNNNYCAAYDIQQINGPERNGIYCPGQPAIPLS